MSALFLFSFGVAYASSMVDDEDRTPDVPSGEGWRFGLGAQYQWSTDLLVGFGYTLVWAGNMNMDQERGTLSGRISGRYGNTSMHFLGVNFRWL